MAREIKFRLWGKEACIMLDPGCNMAITLDGQISALSWLDGDGEVEFGWQGTAYSEGQYEIMQYTGLHDKNGREIYEGDIIRAYKHGDTEKPAHVGDISFLNGCFCFKGYNWHEFLNWFRMVEVIGNIYENPELLGGGTGA